LTSLVEALKAEQRERWQKGERVPAEAYLGRHPTLEGDGEPALELIYHEVLLREELGEAPQLSEYQERFPPFAPRLRLLFEVHRAIASAHWLTPSRLERGGGEPAPLAEASPATTPTVLEPGAPSPAGPEPGGPAIPGYEVLGVLGQGGMGMVYQARHVRLNRVVALKIIRAGAHASPEEVGRFRAEAEAVARLQDPHIVQIYELGEHAGCPYLAPD